MFNIFRKKNVAISIEGTWHICKHDWETKMVSRDGKYIESLCKKCGVHSTTQFFGTRLILVDPESNHPYKFPVWGVPEKGEKGICLRGD